MVWCFFPTTVTLLDWLCPSQLLCRCSSLSWKVNAWYLSMFAVRLNRMNGELLQPRMSRPPANAESNDLIRCMPTASRKLNMFQIPFEHHLGRSGQAWFAWHTWIDLILTCPVAVDTHWQTIYVFNEGANTNRHFPQFSGGGCTQIMTTHEYWTYFADSWRL